MPIPANRQLLVHAMAGAMVATALGGVAAGQQTVDHSGCITASQQLVKVAQGDAPMSPCGPSETEVSWSAQVHTVVRSTMTDLIPGAGLLVAEVEPGVLQVLEDGVHDTRWGLEDVVAGADGSIWVFGREQFYRLGDSATHEWTNQLFDTGQDSSEDIEAAADGTLWWADRDGDGLKSFDGQKWTLERPAPEGEQGTVDQVEVLDDGTVLASWWLGGLGEGRREVARLGEDGWEVIHSVGGSPDAWLGANQAGEVSLMLQSDGNQPVYRETFPRSAEGDIGRTDRPEGWIEWMDVGSDGTIWISLGRGALARHDGDGWTEFDLPPGLPGLGGIQVAPDGSVWSATCGWNAWTCELLRFDGESWGRFFGRLGLGDIDEIAFAPDGTTWSISGNDALYAVLPEAIAAGQE